MQEEIKVQDHVSQFYGKRYSGNGRVYHTHIVRKMFPQKPFGKILDVGCGTGFVQSLHQFSDIYGIDISPKMIEKNKFKDRCKVGSAEELNMHYQTASFDHVICRALLHHVDDPIRVLEQIKYVLKDNGTVSILETNASALNRLPRKLLKKTDRFAGTHKNFEAQELVDMVKRCFTIEDIQFHGFIAYPLIGFPDFINIPLPRKVAQWLIDVDDHLAKSKSRELAFNILIKARRAERKGSSSVIRHLQSQGLSISETSTAPVV